MYNGTRRNSRATILNYPNYYCSNYQYARENASFKLKTYFKATILKFEDKEIYAELYTFIFSLKMVFI